MIKAEDYREFYDKYFKEFNRLAVDEFADLSYGKDVPNDTASSLESVVAYVNYATKRADETDWTGDIDILNAGAGASSWMFRKIALDHPELKLDITCVDPNRKFLEFVRHILEINGLPSDQMYNCMRSNPFDHVYFDYGNIERLPYLGFAIDVAGMSVYVDDVDKRQCCYDYRDITTKLCEAMGLKWFDCEESLDGYERAGIIIEKP